MNSRHRRSLLTIGLILLALIAASLFSVGRGPVRIDLKETLTVLLSKAGIEVPGDHYRAPKESHTRRIIIWEVRMPRVILAILVGAVLSVGGAAMQGIFRNPLADPSLIGISAGGAVGAILMIVLGDFLFATFHRVEPLLVPLAAFTGSIATTYLVYRLSCYDRRSQVVTMLLAGIAMNAIAAAIIGGIVTFSRNDQLRSFVFWSLGTISGSTWNMLAIASPFLLIPLAIFPFYGKVLNAFALGEAEAEYLGFNAQRAQATLITLTAASVGVSVALCGMIGFVGLVVPHLVRLIIGPDNRYLIPASGLMGGLLVVVADLGARTVAAPSELPIGIITAVLGAPFFLILLRLSHRPAT